MNSFSLSIFNHHVLSINSSKYFLNPPTSLPPHFYCHSYFRPPSSDQFLTQPTVSDLATPPSKYIWSYCNKNAINLPNTDLTLSPVLKTLQKDVDKKKKKLKLFNEVSKIFYDQILLSQLSIMVRLGSKILWVQIQALPLLVAV